MYYAIISHRIDYGIMYRVFIELVAYTFVIKLYITINIQAKSICYFKRDQGTYLIL